MNTSGVVGARGTLNAKIIRGRRPTSVRLYRFLNFLNLWRGLWRVWLAVAVSRVTQLPVIYGKLSAIIYRHDGTVIDYGALSYRVVTTAFCADLVDNLIAVNAAFDDYKYHDCGTGTTSEATSDTGLVTPYGGSRAVGTASEPTSVKYRNVGTNSFTSTLAITEHGVFNASSGTTLMDRSVFAALNVVNGDSVQWTYEITMTAGG